jgi:glycosyltransferase involved in cell wall biosynthesis
MKSTAKKKVLIFIDWFLPGEKAGGPVRSCVNLAEHLQDEFDFSVVTRDTDYTESKPYEQVKSDQWNVYDGKRVYYISAAKLNKETIAEIIAQENPDFIYLNGIWSQPFTAWPLKAAKKSKRKIKIVVAARGMLAPSALAIKAAKKKIYLRLAKWRNDFSDVLFHATNAKEAADIRDAMGGKCSIVVAGNLPRKTGQQILHREKEKNKLRIISIARIAPEKNILFALETLALLESNTEADFFGTVYDEEYWKACKAVAEKLPANVKVSFPGAVSSETIFSVLAQYDLLFMPTRGENFGHVILESMQAGTPVLISDQTPWKNLADKNAGWEFPLRSKEKFVQKLEELTGMEENEFRKWREGAFAVAKKYAGDEKVIEENRKLFS